MSTYHGPVPSPRQLAWHRREMYGFIHFTVNTFTDREWGYGDESPDVFAPAALDCRQWAQAAIATGLTGIILTAKHHDGFCLWPTDTTDHCIARSPYKNGSGDIVGELAEACREAGLGFGIYCSPWDRNHPDYGRPGYVEVYHRQWEELLTRYGPLFELWFDGANGGDGYYGGACETRSIDPRTYYRFADLWDRCRELQPDAVIFSDAGPDIRWCGNESGFTGATSWAKVRPEGFAPGAVEDPSRLAAGDADGTVWRPAEVDVSTRPGWFWHPTERPKSPDELFGIWLASVGRGAGLNLNITPDRRGLVPESDVAALIAFRTRIDAFRAVDLSGRAQVTGAGTEAVTVDFGRRQAIGGLRVEESIEHGQRVSGFVVELRHGSIWYEWDRGTTIGARRIMVMHGASGDAVRVRVTSSQAPAMLASLTVYGR